MHVLHKYGLQERVTWEIVTPRKPMSTESISIILYSLRLVSKQSKSSEYLRLYVTLSCSQYLLYYTEC